MTTINSNPSSKIATNSFSNRDGNEDTRMLNNAFAKFDTNHDGQLDQAEFKNFNEIMKPGIAVDQNGKPSIDFYKEMDKNGDGSVSRDEMNSTNYLMPSSLSDDTLKSMINYLSASHDPQALAAAAILRSQPNPMESQPDDSNTTHAVGEA